MQPPALRSKPGARRPRRLAGIPSPYLALYVDDPVDWWPWGGAALAEARRSEKPLLVSVGFFACHWCHVLQKESLRHPAIAALINRHFVPVKVDREIHGALDAALQEFAQRHIGRRGWPLQVLVTPEGVPAAAGLYEPREAFRAQLVGWAERWQADPSAVRREARALTLPAPALPPPVAPDAARAQVLRKRLHADALRRADQLQGGLGTVTKFPAAPQLLALLTPPQDGSTDELIEFLRLTLDQMASQGLRDHVWGGFFRYTVDPGWREPHFEKMTADNALLALVFLRAAALWRAPAWRALALETLAFMRRELWDAGAGAFVSSLSAQDEQGREGGRYLWDMAALAGQLPAAEHATLARIWDTRAAPPQALGHLPMQANAPDTGEQDRLASAYRRLRTLRQGVTHPRDDKLLAGVNGLALVALAEAAPHDRAARADAERVARFIASTLWDGRQLRKLAGSAEVGELADHAYVAWGLARFAAVTRNPQVRALGVNVASAAWARFHRQGWLREAQPLLAGVGAEPVIADTDLPSASATLIIASLELGEPQLAARARDALSVGVHPPLGGALTWATHILALERALAPVQPR